MDYSYSKQTMTASPMTGLLNKIKANIEIKTGEQFNSVLVNYYRDGNDSNGWHSDDEPELGDNPTIASLSLGAPRDFHLRHKQYKELKHKMSLENGSLLMMSGTTQSRWQRDISNNEFFRTEYDRSTVLCVFNHRAWASLLNEIYHRLSDFLDW